MEFALHRTEQIPEVQTARSLCPARRQRLSRALQQTTLNVLIFDTGRLLLSHSDPTPLSLPPSLHLSLALSPSLSSPASLSLPVTGSDRQQMLRCTATTEPDTTTRTRLLCHIRSFNALVPVFGGAERKAVDADGSKAGFNQSDYRDPSGSLARSLVRTTSAWPRNTSSLHSLEATLLWIKHPDLFLVLQTLDFGLHLRLTPGLIQVTSTWTVLDTHWDTKLKHHCCSKSGSLYFWEGSIDSACSCSIFLCLHIWYIVGMCTHRLLWYSCELLLAFVKPFTSTLPLKVSSPAD